MTHDGHAALAQAMREEFDGGFTRPPRAESVAPRHFLAVRIGGDPYALDLAEVTGLQVDRSIVPAPGALPEWLGLAGIRGELVPVYSLPMIMGYEKPTADAARWLVLCNPKKTLGLAFEAFERHLNLEADRIAAVGAGDVKTRHVRAVARVDTQILPVISIESVIAEIARRCATLSDPKEN